MNSTAIKKLKRIDFSQGDMLFNEGDQGFSFYIIQEGKVEVFKEIEGKSKTLGVVNAGEPLGEFALITQSLRSASARALSSGYAVEVSEEGYQELLKELPDWAISVISSLIRRLKDANELVSQRVESSVYELSFDEISQIISR